MNDYATRLSSIAFSAVEAAAVQNKPEEFLNKLVLLKYMAEILLKDVIKDTPSLVR
jgi:hypothetical protein